MKYKSASKMNWISFQLLQYGSAVIEVEVEIFFSTFRALADNHNLINQNLKIIGGN